MRLLREGENLDLLSAAALIQKKKKLKELADKSDKQLLQMVLSQDLEGFYSRGGSAAKAIIEKPFLNLEQMARGCHRKELVKGCQAP